MSNLKNLLKKYIESKTKKPNKAKNTFLFGAFAFLSGAIGAVTVLFTTNKTGAQNRKAFKEQSEKFAKNSKEQAENLTKKTTEIASNLTKDLGKKTLSLKENVASKLKDISNKLSHKKDESIEVETVKAAEEKLNK